MSAAVRLAAATVRLPDGRRLACTTLGPADGLPVLQFHGAIGTPVRACPDTERVLGEAGVRLVLPQRPGFGGSDPAPRRTLTTWPADVAALADGLGLERFAVLGVSAGGPYAAACARALPDRVTVTVLASSTVPLWGPDALPAATPLLRLGVRTVRHPQASRHASDLAIRAVRARPAALLGIVERRGGRADRAHLDARRRAEMTAGVLEATAGGPACILEDVRIALGPWGFAPREVPGEVLLWHGREDATVPVEHALAHTSTVPGLRATVLDGEGHFFLRARLPELLAAIRRAWPHGARLAAPAPRDVPAVVRRATR